MSIDTTQETLDTLKAQGVFDIKNGSAELFFDDIGILQQIVFKKKKRKEPQHDLKVYTTHNGTAICNYDNDGTLQQITYETKWKRNR